MHIILNGKRYPIERETTLHDLVTKLGCKPGGVAIALNETVIPRSKYPETALKDQDSVEIVTAFQGG